jgi:hypothetical protein
MLDNARFWARQATEIAAQLSALVVDGDDPAAVAEADRLAQAYATARDRAQGASRDCAPYVHPRMLAQLYIPPARLPGEKPLAEQLPSDPQEVAAAYRRIVRGLP